MSLFNQLTRITIFLLASTTALGAYANLSQPSPIARSVDQAQAANLVSYPFLGEAYEPSKMLFATRDANTPVANVTTEMQNEALDHPHARFTRGFHNIIVSSLGSSFFRSTMLFRHVALQEGQNYLVYQRIVDGKRMVSINQYKVDTRFTPQQKGYYIVGDAVSSVLPFGTYEKSGL